MLNRPSKAVVTRVIGIVGALVALSAFLMLSNMPGLVFAQATGIIMYAENGDSPVRTFTSEDPEGMGIYWDVTGTDADDFSISGGVLEFNNPPNFEKPTDRPHGTLDFNEDDDIDDMGEAARDNETGDIRSTNTYQVTIRASEMRADSYMGRALSTETHVTVMVTDKERAGRGEAEPAPARGRDHDYGILERPGRHNRYYGQDYHRLVAVVYLHGHEPCD